METNGFFDAHIHIWEYCLFNYFTSLEGLSSLDAMAEQMKAKTVNGWAVGVRFNQEDSGGTIPDRKMLDCYFARQPALLVRNCLHLLVMNTAAMEKLNCYSPDGIFREANVFALLDKICHLLQLNLLAIRQAGWTRLAEAGITRIIDMAMTPYKYRLFPDVPFFTADFTLLSQALGFKVFLDGGLGARTAALTEDYADDPGNRGLLNHSPEALLSLVEKVHQLNKPLAFHAIGDRAVEQLLWVLARSRHPRDRVEHVQYARREQLDDLAELQIPVCIQPIASREISWARQRLGERRMPTAYAWNLMRQKGIKLLAGSDAPVDEVDPRKAALLVDKLEGNQHLDYAFTLELFTVHNREILSNN